MQSFGYHKKSRTLKYFFPLYRLLPMLFTNHRDASKFLVKSLHKNRNFIQKSRYLAKIIFLVIIDILVKIRNFGRKWKLCFNIFVKSWRTKIGHTYDIYSILNYGPARCPRQRVATATYYNCIQYAIQYTITIQRAQKRVSKTPI